MGEDLHIWGAFIGAGRVILNGFLGFGV